MKKIIVMILFIGFCFGCDTNPQKATPTQTALPPLILESESDYIASTKKIGIKKDPLYYKEFLKNPDKYKGVRVNILGKIFDIEESKVENKLMTAIQMYINNNYDSVIVYYQGSVNVYKDDIVTVYGQIYGTIEGKNRMGVDMRWPVIVARHIKKRGETN